MRYEKQNIFFISDLHIGHKKVIQYDKRPFKSVEEMHIEMIKRWNSVITDDDIVYFLGDLSMCGIQLTSWFVHSLKGKIHFIMGNHDKYKTISKLDRWERIYEYGTEIDVLDKDSEAVRGSAGYQKIIMSHYPIFSWNKSHYGSWHLHGHSHGSLIPKQLDYYKRKVIDVGCNVIDYTPISYTDVKSKMSKKRHESVDHH